MQVQKRARSAIAQPVVAKDDVGGETPQPKLRRLKPFDEKNGSDDWMADDRLASFLQNHVEGDSQDIPPTQPEVDFPNLPPYSAGFGGKRIVEVSFLYFLFCGSFFRSFPVDVLLFAGR